MYDGGFIKGKKIKMKNWIFHPNREGGGGWGDQQSFRFCTVSFFCIGGREHVFRARNCAEISWLWLFLHFELVSFLAFRSCLVFWWRIFWFVCARSWTAISEGIFASAFCSCIFFFLQQGFQRAFPSARFQHVSFSKVPACFLPSSKVLCVCLLVLQCPRGFFWGSISSLFP